ncbi:MAG: hypothetical protein KJZ72_17340, partial [Anaerolineales bacterium]|nr:hypothetical protein [Anaerolineales bacterium]
TRNRPLTRRVLCRLSYVGEALSEQIIPKQHCASSNLHGNDSEIIIEFPPLTFKVNWYII